MTSQTLPDIELLSIPTEPGHNDSVSDREAVVRRALVVDDSPKILEMFSSILTSWGYDVLTASDGAEAWHMMQKMDIPLVVLDWHMPEMSGIELCEAIRRKFGAQSRYLILITAEITKDSYKDFLTAGIDDYIRKPLDPISIHAAVRMAERIQSLNQRLIRETAELEEMRRRRLDVHVERLEMDINAAATYQQSDFPALSDRLGDLQFETVFHPASTISGDTFNYFTTDSTWTNFYSIDVAGHGMASGLLAVTLNTILRDGSCAYRFTEDGVFNIEGKKISTPAELCADLNETFQTDGLTRPYFTMVAGSYNRHQRLMRVCLAGHPPPVIIKKSGEAIFCRRFRLPHRSDRNRRVRGFDFRTRTGRPFRCGDRRHYRGRRRSPEYAVRLRADGGVPGIRAGQAADRDDRNAGRESAELERRREAGRRHYHPIL